MSPYLVAAISASSIVALAAIVAASGSAMNGALLAQESAQIQAQRQQESLQVLVSDDTLKIKNAGLGTITIKEIRLYSDSATHSSKKFQEPGLRLGPLQALSYTPSEFSAASFSEMTVLAITDLGNVFSATDPGRGDSANAMINGMGINSRIIARQYEGKIIHGYGDSGAEDSLKAYNLFSTVHDFAAQVLQSEPQITIPITKFNTQYRYTQQSLQAESASDSNVLGFSQSRILGGASVAVGTDKITISGNGYVILKLNDYAQSMVLEGNVPAGSQLVLSRLSSKNLFDVPYDETRGFRIFDVAASAFSTSQTSHSDITCSRGAWGYTNTYMSAYSFSPQLPVSNQWSLSYGPLSVGASAPAATVTSSKIASISQGGQTFVPSAWCSGTASAYYYSPTSATVWDRDPIQWIDYAVDFDSAFQTVYTLGTQMYLIAKPNGATITIKGTQFSPATTPYLKITGLPPNIPYEILKDGKLAVSGMASDDGTVSLLVGDINIGGSSPAGTLYLYPDSAKYRGPFSTVIFDNVNSQTIHILTDENKVYVVHAYVQIPITGDAQITDTYLDDALALPYLDGNYTTGQYVMVPIIPGYYNIDMKINQIQTITKISNVLGGGGVKVIAPSTSTITKSDDNNPVSSIAATAEAVSYVIATSSGMMTTAITAMISGDSEIQNSAYFGVAPPAPPAPHPKDPLKAWVDVYKNGVLSSQQQIYLNSLPTAQNSGGVSGLSSYVTDKYVYPQTVVSGAITTSVSPGDFVEFYLHANIEAEGTTPPIPPGHVLYHYSGNGHATASIHGGSMISS